MDAERWRRVRALTERALEVASERREAWIAERCADEPELRADVLALARASDRAPVFVDRPAAATFGTNEADGGAGEDPWVGRTVDGWTIEAVLGAGGMGTVYRATGDGRAVALKVVRTGLDGGSWKERFEAERATLQALDHPDIVRCLGAGALPDGRPYLVMELVHGVPIDQWCRSRSASLVERLRLMRAVCLAVQGAHRALVVHRDLKPQNVLVTPDGRPKLCDFGVAKLLERGVERSATTIGTPAPLTPRYAAPEQLAEGPITTACDVYALGVLFAELLEPEHRSRDLETVLAMARRAEPERRYASVAQLADDLERVALGRPVHARPDSIGYRLSRFVARNRIASALALVAAVALVIAAISTWFGLERARASEALAWRAHAQAVSVASFYRQLFDTVDPDELAAIDLVTGLDERVAALPELDEWPETEGRVRAEIGHLYLRLGRPADARPHLLRALELARSVRGFGERDVVRIGELVERCETELAAR